MFERSIIKGDANFQIKYLKKLFYSNILRNYLNSNRRIYFEMLFI